MKCKFLLLLVALWVSTTINAVTIKAVVPSTWGSNIYAWVWEDGSEGNWVQMTAVNDSVYSYTMNAPFNIIISADGNWQDDNRLTCDISVPTNICVKIMGYTVVSGAYLESRLAYSNVDCATYSAQINYVKVELRQNYAVAGSVNLLPESEWTPIAKRVSARQLINNNYQGIVTDIYFNLNGWNQSGKGAAYSFSEDACWFGLSGMSHEDIYFSYNNPQEQSSSPRVSMIYNGGVYVDENHYNSYISMLPTVDDSLYHFSFSQPCYISYGALTQQVYAKYNTLDYIYFDIIDSLGGDLSHLSAGSYILEATANEGYYFDQWSDGNKENPRKITLTQDTIFEAVFIPYYIHSKMPTDIKEYTQEGIVKGKDFSIPISYLAFKEGCSSSSEIGVDLISPSGKYYTIIGTSYTNWADQRFHTFQYFNSKSWCYAYTTVLNGYAFFDLQAIESGFWILYGVQRYAGDWYYVNTAINVNNVITYSATAKLSETTRQWSSGLHTNAFNVSIKSHTFSDNKGTIVFSGNVTSVGTCAFYESKGLTSITLPNSVKSIGFAAFDSCSNLATVVLGDSLNNIGSCAFLGARNLESINVPNCLTSIGDYAFGLCYKLVSLNVSDSVTYIGDGAFSSCSSLTSINIPNNLKEIRIFTFFECSKLNSVIIPSSITSINDAAFKHCSGLTSITCQANTPPTCGNNCFFDVDKSIPLYVPNSSYDAYKSANVWKEFLNLRYSTKCKITTNSNSSIFGSVTGAGLTDIPNVILTATPNEHYHFVQWSDGNTDNPREIVVTQDTTFTAEFAINQYTVSIRSDNPSAGIVSGSGTYDALTNVTVLAAASAVGYKWDKWSDGVTLAGRQITLTSDTTLTAYFISADEVECIEVEENNALLGTADIQIIATPNNGAQFIQWSDGNTENPRIVTDAPGIYTAIFSDTTTKTSSITADQQKAIQKRIVDNQLLILRDGKTYNAQGGEL